MHHLTDDDLVLHYYGEADPPDRDRADAHLEACDACRTRLARMREGLALADDPPVAEPDAEFEARMWARIEPALPKRARSRGLFGGKVSWAAAGAMAASVLAAFLVGWLARGGAPGTVIEPPAAEDEGPVRERVLIVAVGAHLERSQMVLVELMNADGTGLVNVEGPRERAVELVADNRLYRQTAALTGDEALDEVLNDLERVLLEIANGPAEVPAPELDALRARIESRGILFRVRVLGSEMREREAQDVVRRQKGSTS